MRVLDLFSGIGGFSLGLERAGMQTVAFCEIDSYCRRVLNRHWPGIPIFNDIRTLRGVAFNDIGLVCGGYPCQPFSTAGKRKGAEDDRNLWHEMFRIIKEVGPRWVIAENVAGHVSMGLDDVLSDLETSGYTCWPFIIPACALKAPSRRERVWVIAHSKCVRQQGQGGCIEQVNTTADYYREAGGLINAFLRGSLPYVCRRHNGIPARLDASKRLKALGNAIDAQIPEIIGKAIMQIENGNLE